MSTAKAKAAPVFSCEFFPPRTEAGMEKLRQTWQALDDAIAPEYFSVTFGAGGSTRDSTLETVKQLRQLGARVTPHISCIGSSRAQLGALLDSYRDLGIDQLVTLRGDRPKDGDVTGDFRYASELVAFIREHSGDHFHIEVAAYPEYHPESASPQADFEHFVQKVKAGANGAITQYFYNIDAWRNFIDNCERAGLAIPVTPGIMPITGFDNLVRFSDMCGAEIPRWIRKQLEAWADDLPSLRAFGRDVVTRLCQQLLDEGAPGLHFYTLNQTDPTLAIWQGLRHKA